MSGRVHEAIVWQGSTPTLLAYVHGYVDGDVAALTQSSITSISIAVASVSSAESTFEDDLDKTEVIFDTLQEDGRWVDSDGEPVPYNFAYTLPEEALPEGGWRYRAEVEFVMTDDSKGYAVWELDSRRRYGVAGS